MSSVRTFLGSYGGPIARAVRRRVYTLAAATGVTVTHCIGRGVNGCVFMASDGGVLKVSAHDGEAPLAMAVAGPRRAMPFLPVFHGGWLLPGGLLGLPEGWELGVTHREDLRDFVAARPHWYMARANDLIATADSARRSRSSEWLEERFRDMLREFAETAVGIDMRALRAMAQFFVWSHRTGLRYDLDEFSGVHAMRNLGISVQDDTVVIRDLGNLEPRKGAVKRLTTANPCPCLPDDGAITRVP